MISSKTDYWNSDRVHWSSLRHLETSAKLYKYRLDNPTQRTPEMVMGSAVHTAVLEPDRFPLEYVVYPGPVRRGKKWEEFEAANRDKTILKANEYQRCLNIRDSVRSHPLAGELLIGGVAEFPVYWIDPGTGIECKGLVDYYIGDYGGRDVLLDLKTSSSIQQRFGSIAADHGYHKQLAFYRRGLRANDFEIDEVKIIAVESAAPHDVIVYGLPDELLDYADAEIGKLLEELAKCRRKNSWPGMCATEQTLELPVWAFPDEEFELNIGGETHAV